MSMLLHVFAALALAGAVAEPGGVLITGATGRTGSKLYAQLKAQAAVGEVRAFVRSAEKARKVLGCKSCDESEGVFMGEVNDTVALTRAVSGVATVAICVGVTGSEPAAVQRAVEFAGVENTVAALGQVGNVAHFGLASLRAVFLSSMGTTLPSPGKEQGGGILFWKKSAEAFVGSSGLGATIVKPCGLPDGMAGQNSTLLVGHDDTLLSTAPPIVSRDDVAAVMAQAVVERSSSLRFDLCSTPGPPPPSMAALLEKARWPWQRSA
jgi:uncharacterized protein YbjT (DUF2867 family)